LDSEVILVDTEKKTIECKNKPILVPNQREIFDELWKIYQSTPLKLSRISLSQIQNLILQFLNPITYFIIADVSTSKSVFQFQKEPYLNNFPREQRIFLNSFIDTQMANVYINTEYEKKVQEFKYSKSSQ
jgi:hypothetical protein